MFHVTPLGLVIITWGGWVRVALFLLVYAAFIMVGFVMLLRAAGNTKKAKARRDLEIPAETRARIGELSDRVLQGLDRERVLREQNARMRAQLTEESNHGRNWRSDVEKILHETAP